jgi:hypothetical protein
MNRILGKARAIPVNSPLGGKRQPLLHDKVPRPPTPVTLSKYAPEEAVFASKEVCVPASDAD